MTDRIVTIADLDPIEDDIVNSLLHQLAAKAGRNRLRAAYYDGKNALHDIGISTPPQFRRIAFVLGWSAKACDLLSRRCCLTRFVIPGSTDTSDLDQLWDDNYLTTESNNVGLSSLIHSTAFLIATQGDVQAGEPAVLIHAKSALQGTGHWNLRARALDSFLSVISCDDQGVPTDLILYLPNLNVTMTKVGHAWVVTRREHQYGLPVEPLAYKGDLEHPFGRSRISRAVMSLHDGALRTVLRSEVSAELYSVPQRVLLGADETAFKNADGTIKTAWQAILGRVWAIPDDEDAATPRAEIKEFTAASQEPHMAQLRAQAQLFAGETSIPLSSLGISTDANPQSAEAYLASREDLIMEAEGTTDGWSPAWKRTMLRGLQMQNQWSPEEIPADVRKLAPKWRSPKNPTRAAEVDAGVKMLTVFPWMAETELGLEMCGFDDAFIARALPIMNRQRGSAALMALTAAAAAGRPAVALPATMAANVGP